MTIAPIVRVAAAVAAAAALSTTAAANAPAGRYTAGGGTVYDSKTKLTWQQTAPTTTYSWADAKTYCASAAVRTALGGTGWRLPTIKELQSLVDYSQTAAPFIDSQFFPGTPASYFWSATPAADYPTYAWNLNFNNGSPSLNNAATTVIDVRCVR